MTILSANQYPYFPGKGYAVSAGYPMYSSGAPHPGIDFEASPGTPIPAAADGEVIYSNPTKKSSTAGYFVAIKHTATDGTVFVTMYMHMNGKDMLKEGDKVVAGQMVGRVGSTGRSTGPHLHFEIARGKNTPVDVLNPKTRVTENPNTWNKWPASGSWNPKAGERLVRSKDLGDKIEAV